MSLFSKTVGFRKAELATLHFFNTVYCITNDIFILPSYSHRIDLSNKCLLNNIKQNSSVRRVAKIVRAFVTTEGCIIKLSRNYRLSPPLVLSCSRGKKLLHLATLKVPPSGKLWRRPGLRHCQHFSFTSE